MIFWTVIWMIPIFIILVCVVGLFVASNTGNEDGFLVAIVVTLIISAALGLICFTVAANAQDKKITASSDHYLIESYTEKRDTLVPLVENELSPEQFKALMAAYDEADLLLIFGNNVSDILLQRAEQIVGYNAQIEDLKVGIVEKQKWVCDYTANPFAIQFPFGLGMPECELE